MPEKSAISFGTPSPFFIGLKFRTDLFLFGVAIKENGPSAVTNHKCEPALSRQVLESSCQGPRVTETLNLLSNREGNLPG